MTQAADLLLGLLREAWIALVGALLVCALLAVLAQVLRAATGSLMGAQLWIWEAVSVSLALLALALFAFIGVPLILRAVQSAIPSGGGCGPIVRLGNLASGLIAALAALRILLALVATTSAMMMGGRGSIAEALLGTGEAVLGMVLASAASPLAAHFLGVC